MNVYNQLNSPGTKIAVLVDPDKPTDKTITALALNAKEAAVDFFFVGGSLLTNDNMDSCIKILKTLTDIPVVIFPGNSLQLSKKADAFLFLSLISSRNPEMLIGRHVISAPYLKLAGLEVISTGYMLIDSGKPTTVSYMSNSVPIPSDKNEIALCTAMAGEMLGMKLIFMDAGSGAYNPVPESMIKAVKGSIDVPLIIGGGLKTPEMAANAVNAGADIVVVGNALENNPELLKSFADAVHMIH
ncbi:MAG: geranylgeranylglyceryl/heptaprenylglyceryl phosphate synthase [Bacteroidales bacterium]|nr:geranylgeranylglyceryl/heptaprenylglyceryl phosphate synthase [Bacteroidales bacterium]